jgi:hypothetical protein
MRPRLFLPLALLLLAALACNYPRQGVTPTPTVIGPDRILTYAAQTIEARLTLDATAVQPTFTPGPPGTTAPPPPATGSPLPPPASASPTSCDRGDFVEDVTYPDNSAVSPGAEFIKTWRLKNTSDCEWNSSYSVVFDHGDSLGGPASQPLTTGVIQPGAAFEVSLALTAPGDEGDYQGFYRLRNPAGQVFGLGESGDKDFWVKVSVQEASQGEFDFIAQASSATWVGRDGEDVTLAFGGSRDDPDGAAWLEDELTLENGSGAGRTLMVHPKHAEDGEIVGTFAPFEVRDGNHFTAKLGFPEDCGDAQVIYQLWYRQGDEMNRLEEWGETCNGELGFADVDLSDLDGQTVQFVLVVLADGSFEDDTAIWGSAQIVE